MCYHYHYYYSVAWIETDGGSVRPGRQFLRVGNFWEAAIIGGWNLGGRNFCRAELLVYCNGRRTGINDPGWIRFNKLNIQVILLCIQLQCNHTNLTPRHVGLFQVIFKHSQQRSGSSLQGTERYWPNCRLTSCLLAFFLTLFLLLYSFESLYDIDEAIRVSQIMLTESFLLRKKVFGVSLLLLQYTQRRSTETETSKEGSLNYLKGDSLFSLDIQVLDSVTLLRIYNASSANV